MADYAVVSLHGLWVYLEKSYPEALDLPSEILHILAEISLNAADLPDHSTLVSLEEAYREIIETGLEAVEHPDEL